MIRIPIPTHELDNDSRPGIPLQGDWAACGICSCISHLLPESHHRNCLCEAPLLSAEPPCLSIIRKRNNQIKQKGFFYTYNLVDIMNMITFIIIYPNLLENLIVGHVLINNLLGYFNV